MFKGFGSLKKEMIHWNIFQLIIWLNRCVERIYTEMFLEIKDVLNDTEKSKLCAKWMENVWDDFFSYAVSHNSVNYSFDINEHTFIVWDTNNKSDTW